VLRRSDARSVSRSKNYRFKRYSVLISFASETQFLFTFYGPSEIACPPAICYISNRRLVFKSLLSVDERYPRLLIWPSMSRGRTTSRINESLIHCTIPSLP
jgi:hypothetical protein